MARVPKGAIRKRGGRWYIRYQLDGNRIEKATDALTRAEAQRLLIEEMARAGSRSKEALNGLRRALTLGEAAQGWIDAAKRPTGDRARIVAFAREIGPAFSVSEVDSAMVSDWIAARRKVVADVTVARETTIASAFFTWAIQKRLTTSHPVRDAAKVTGAVSGSPEPLTADEVRMTLAAVRGDPTLEPTYMLALYGGLRRGEIPKVLWEDCDLDAGIMLVRGTKTRRSWGRITILDQLLEWMRAHPNRDGAIVRGLDGSGPIKPASLENRRVRWNSDPERQVTLPNFHRCRHTLGHRLIMGGFKIAEVAEQLRDSVQMVQQVYGHFGSVEFRERYSGFRM